MKRGRILGIPILLIAAVAAFFLFRKQLPSLVDKVKGLLGKKDNALAQATGVTADPSLPNGNIQNINN